MVHTEPFGSSNQIKPISGRDMKPRVRPFFLMPFPRREKADVPKMSVSKVTLGSNWDNERETASMW
jgi:hypothetical protein